MLKSCHVCDNFLHRALSPTPFIFQLGDKCKQRGLGYWWCYYPNMTMFIFRKWRAQRGGESRQENEFPWPQHMLGVGSLMGNWETSSLLGPPCFRLTEDGNGQIWKMLKHQIAASELPIAITCHSKARKTWWGTSLLGCTHPATKLLSYAPVREGAALMKKCLV